MTTHEPLRKRCITDFEQFKTFFDNFLINIDPISNMVTLLSLIRPGLSSIWEWCYRFDYSLIDNVVIIYFDRKHCHVEIEMYPDYDSITVRFILPNGNNEHDYRFSLNSNDISHKQLREIAREIETALGVSK